MSISDRAAECISGGRATLGIRRGSDLVVDGTDRLSTRYQVNDACVLQRKMLVSAAIHRFEGQTFSYVGSSAWIATTSDRPVFDPQMRTVTWAHIVPGLYAPNGTMQSAGGSYAWLKNQICRQEAVGRHLERRQSGTGLRIAA